jgi:hypothetical protein
MGVMAPTSLRRNDPAMTHPEILIGRTGSAEYLLRGAWFYRRTPAYTQRYDTLHGFVAKMLASALGSSWRETPQGKTLIARFIS